MVCTIGPAPRRLSLLQFLYSNHSGDREYLSGRALGVENMSSHKKVRLIGAFFALAALGLAASCTGFFVNPTLTGVTVGPQATLNLNQSIQMSATGTYTDGSQKQLTSGVTWSSSDSSAVSITAGGLATGVTIGSATITGSAGSCSACTGTTTVTVALQGVTSVIVSPANQTVIRSGNAVYFHASANGSTDISNPADGTTWTVVDSSGTDQTSNFVLSYVAGTTTGTGEGIAASSGATAGTYTVEATYNAIVGKATLNVQ